MLGNFQQSQIRIELEATADAIRNSLLRPYQMRQWLWQQRLPDGLPEELYSGFKFTSWFGPVSIEHYVDIADSNCLRLLLSQGIDGYHEWYWGEGWVQSRLEGVSLLPLNLGQSVSLFSLREFLNRKQQNS